MSHWTEVSRNPNSAEARRSRREVLDRARRPPVPNRAEHLAEIARGKRVLDVGIVDHGEFSRGRSSWLHGHVARAAGYCLGIDVLADEVEKIRAKGYNARVADITRAPYDGGIDEQFDVIVCGDVIEHLGSPEGLFRAASHLLSPGGRLVITTPNAFFLGVIRRHLFGRENDSVDHVTLLFPSGIAELSEREGLALASYRGTMLGTESSRRRLVFRLRKLFPLLGLRVACACPTIIYECVMPG